MEAKSTLFSARERMVILRALDRAAFDADRDGWATASEVRLATGVDCGPQGTWARRLWDLQDAGLAEARPIQAGMYLWGVTDEGGRLLLEADTRV